MNTHTQNHTKSRHTPLRTAASVTELSKINVYLSLRLKFLVFSAVQAHQGLRITAITLETGTVIQRDGSISQG